MRRHSDNPALPPACPNCKRRYYHGYYGWTVTMDAGVCRPCAQERREKVAAMNKEKRYGSRPSPWHPMSGRRRYRDWRDPPRGGMQQRSYLRDGKIVRATFWGYDWYDF